MNIKGVYDAIGSDYDNVIARLRKEDRIHKYIMLFKKSDDYDSLVKALEGEDYETAYRMAHSLKGLSANLGFDALFEVSGQLCEELKAGKTADQVSEQLACVAEKYSRVMEAVNMLEEV